MKLGTYSFGMGDRFGRQGKAQLMAIAKSRQAGMDIVPVWNKSYREHSIIGTTHGDVRREADAAVRSLGFTGEYHVDADHIGLKTVETFIEHSDFFTLDVADFTGKPADTSAIDGFVHKHADLIGSIVIPGIDHSFNVSRDQMHVIAAKYLLAVQEAGRIYRYIAERKGADNIVAEVSMDETDAPQTPIGLLFILAMIADEAIPAQTIAPRFSGRFNKGVEYVGDVEQFAREFEQDVLVIRYATGRFGLAEGLKLSVHSGSDKFAIYAPIHRIIREHKTGVHVKTAGTTWLEEIIGLAAAGGSGLEMAKEIYRTALGRFDELCGPYASVIDIDTNKLPAPDIVDTWDGERMVAALRHNQAEPSYNPHMRQMLHVGYKVAAEMGDRFYQALDEHAEVIGPKVTENLFDRHLKPLFLSV